MGNPTSVLLGQSFNATTTGSLATFTGTELLNVQLAVTSGIIHAATVRLESTVDGSPQGYFLYPQLVARWQQLPAPNMSLRFVVDDVSGGGTLTISV